VACCLLLAGGTVLAFFSGGYFDQPRLIAALCAWLLVAAAALTAPRPLPRSAPGRLALGGLAALAALTIASIAWAPLAGAALDDAQRALLYLAAFAAGFAFLRADRFVEPALAGGALVVVLYGLAERLVPGLVDLNASRTAGGRLEQPITYWNAMGAVAAMGLVVCARMAADAERPDRVRAAAAAAVPPLGAAIYLTFSRGAIAAVAAGLLVLVLLAKEQAQLRAAAVAVAAGLVAAVACAVFPWVRSLSEGGPLSESVQGLVALALLVALGALAAWITLRWTAATNRDTALTASPRARLLAAAGLCVALALVSAAFEGSPRSSSPQAGASTARLSSLDSARYGYWRVALETFADQPLLGAGASGFRVEWMRERTERDASSDAHSLYLETLAELGLAGAAALLVMLTGLALSGRRALLAAPHAVLGLVALLASYLVHAAVDWGWEMPAVTLPALAAAAAIVAVADRAGPSAGRARPGARAGSNGAPRESPAATAADPA
jgi:O-antigen ligase